VLPLNVLSISFMRTFARILERKCSTVCPNNDQDKNAAQLFFIALTNKTTCMNEKLKSNATRKRKMHKSFILRV